MTLTYKKAKVKKAESLLRNQLLTNEGSEAEAGGLPTTVVTKKKKRSLIGEKYYEEFSTEFWKEPDICFSDNSCLLW